MSRGIKDLRELICISRLTIRESDDDEHYISDDDTSSETGQAGNGVAELSELSLSDYSSGGEKPCTPDSGLGTNVDSPQSTSSEQIDGTRKKVSFLPMPPTEKKPAAAKKRQKKRCRSKAKTVTTNTLADVKPKSLIPDEAVQKLLIPRPPLGPISPTEKVRTNFDEFMIYLDAGLIADWLQQSNKQVKDMSQWCRTGDNFIEVYILF